MNYTIINKIEFIENIIGKKGRPKDNERILTGNRINKLDECHEVLETMDTLKQSDLDVLRSTEDYMRRKNIPFAITEEGNTRYNHFYVYGKEIVRQKSESKKLSTGVRNIVNENWGAYPS